MPIRRRLVLQAVLVAAAGMTVFSVLLGGLAAAGVAYETDALLARLATEAAGAIETQSAGQLGGGSPLVLPEVAAGTDPFVVVLDRDGGVLYHTAVLDGAPPRLPAAAAVVGEATEVGSATATVVAGDGVELRVHAQRWQRPDAGTGVALAARSTRFVGEQVGGLTFFLLLSLVVTLVLVAIVSRIVVGRALRPLRTLAATAEDIGRTGDLTRGLPPAGSRDEVGALTGSFNGMLDRLRAAQEGLAAALYGQRRFVADASHELRTPLTTIRTNAGFLRDHPNLGAADRIEAVGDIAAESDRMSRLVDDLFALARADAGQPPVHRPLDLRAIVQQVGAAAGRASGAGRPVQVRADVSAPVVGDADELTRLVWILVDNGLRHGAGVVDITLDVEPYPGPGWVVLRVSDEGPGIPPTERGRIFEPFHRADPTRAGAGTGLGLSIARSIVHAHRGSIRADARERGGALIEVRLPIASSRP